MKVRAKMFLGFATIALLWGGGQRVYTAATNLEPASYSMEEYLSDRPDDKWLTLSDTELSLPQASYAQTRFIGKVNELYIPVFSTEDKAQGFIQVVLATKNETQLQTLQDLQAAAEQGEETVIEYAAANQDKLFPQGEVSGLVQYGIDVDDDTRLQLKDLYGDQLAEDFIFLKDGAKPNFLLAGLPLVAGLLLGGVLLKSFVPKRQTETAEEPV